MPAPIRLALAGISHETNTFSVVPATLAWFADEGILRGDEIRTVYGMSLTDVAGFLAAGDVPAVTVEPLLFTYVNPSGTITADASCSTPRPSPRATRPASAPPSPSTSAPEPTAGTAGPST